MEATTTDEAWEALSRTLARRLYELPPVAFKLYLYEYLTAAYSRGEGISSISIAKAAERLNLTNITIRRAHRLLEEEGLVQMLRTANSPNKNNEIKILDFKSAGEIIKAGESFVPISMGLLDHMPRLKGVEFKVLMYGIVEAKPHGKYPGLFGTRFRELAEHIRSSKSSVSQAITALTPHYFMIYLQAKNRHEQSVYRVQKYKTTDSYLPDPTVRRDAYGEPIAPGEYDNFNLHNFTRVA